MSKTPKKTEADYHFLAEQRGFQWLGVELPKAVNQVTKWSCSEGHEWNGRYSDIQRGTGCPYCAGLAKKTRINYHDLAHSRGFEWIDSDLPKGVGCLSKWRCSKGHEWMGRYTHIQQGKGCPQCPKKTSLKNADDYRKLASDRGFEWVANGIPKNSKQKTMWQCPQGHEWGAPYSAIKSGDSCPFCVNYVNGKKVSQVQCTLASRLGGIVNFKDCNTHIDIALIVNGVNIAIEYDGSFWHRNTQERDAKTTQRLIDGGWHVLRIKSARRDPLPSNKQLFTAMNKLVNGLDYIEIDMTQQKFTAKDGVMDMTNSTQTMMIVLTDEERKLLQEFAQSQGIPNIAYAVGALLRENQRLIDELWDAKLARPNPALDALIADAQADAAAGRGLNITPADLSDDEI